MLIHSWKERKKVFKEDFTYGSLGKLKKKCEMCISTILNSNFGRHHKNKLSNKNENKVNNILCPN